MCCWIVHLRALLCLSNVSNFSHGPWMKSYGPVFIVLLAAASKMYIGSVLFRTSAYTGAKQASRVPFWFRDLSRQTISYQDISSHFSSGPSVPLFGSPRPIFYNGVEIINAILLCVKIYFLNLLLYKKMTFDQVHIGKFYHISCNTVPCRLFLTNSLCLFVCMYIHEYILLVLL